MSTTPTRDWLAEAIRAAHRHDCGSCRSAARTCPEHAAEAVLDAFRQVRAEAYEQLANDLDRWKAYGPTMALEGLAEHVRDLAAEARKTDGETGKGRET